MAILAISTFSTTAQADTNEHLPIKNEQGQVVGAIIEPLKTEANVAPSVMIKLNDGTQRALLASSLQRVGDAYILHPVSTPKSETDEAMNAAFEVRSMTMVLIMQSHEDTKLLSDISNLAYDVKDNKLYLVGDLPNTYGLERLLDVTSELCEFEIVPNITIKPAEARS
ncbi:hypothetical protein [Cerasicoccus maritimus]|uniref:hypothetical protein n=1 Tax=Cerasicoccus maritimus TaxID=490089 RepID=UPI0028524CAF|nr:hypothetical protein [Cerasicoccus maritimus]